MGLRIPKLGMSSSMTASLKVFGRLRWGTHVHWVIWPAYFQFACPRECVESEEARQHTQVDHFGEGDVSIVTRFKMPVKCMVSSLNQFASH